MLKYKILLIAFFIVTTTFSNAACAQVIRAFPADSKLGKLKKFAYPKVKIDSKKFYLSAGSQIRDKNNFIVQPATMHEKGPIRYQMDAMGSVHRIWLLSKEETKKERKK